MPSSFRSLIVGLTVATTLVSSVAAAQSAPATGDESPRSLRLQPAAEPAAPSADEAQAAARDVRDEAPRLGLVESPFGMAGGSLMAGLTGTGVTSKEASTSAGGLQLGGAPLSRLTIHGVIGRDAGGTWAPTVAAHLRFLGSLPEGYALGALAQYKTEGFTEAGGEAELGVTGGLRKAGFAADINLVAGVGVEEEEVGEADGEARLRLGYDVVPAFRLGAEGQVRKRLAGERELAGGKTWDALGGPQMTLRFGNFVAMLSGGATTVAIAKSAGAYAMLTVAGFTY